ncbi:MAG: hypothetical protein ACE5FH_05475 [Candidatus Zixiibacteriota bacterium]
MTDSFFNQDVEPNHVGEIPDLDGAQEGTGAGTDSFKTEEGRMAAIMSYIPVLCFVPLLNMKENPEARFHARQGMMLFLIELLALLFLIDGVSAFVFKAILMAAVALSVVGVFFALKGKNYKLPVIGDLADKAKL